MDEYLKLLNEKLKLLSYKKEEDTLHIYCEMEKEENKKVHERYERVVDDLPFGEFKVKLHIRARRYEKNDNNNASDKKTEVEKLDFLNNSGRRTKRLENKMEIILQENSFSSAERLIKEVYVNISDTTLLRIFKKKKS